MNAFLLALLLLAAGHVASADDTTPEVTAQSGLPSTDLLAPLQVHRHLVKKNPRPTPAPTAFISAASALPAKISGISAISAVSAVPAKRPNIKAILNLALKIKLALEAHEALVNLLERAANKGNTKAEDLIAINNLAKAAKDKVSAAVLGKELVDKLQALDERKEAAEDAALKHVVGSAQKVISGKGGLLG